MVTIDQVAQAVLHDDAIIARSVAQLFLQQQPTLAHIPLPQTDDQYLLAVSASLLELFAERTNQPVPAWTATIQPLPEPLFLVQSAHTMKRLRALCEAESPLPLRKRRLYAPPNYLTFV